MPPGGPADVCPPAGRQAPAAPPPWDRCEPLVPPGRTARCCRRRGPSRAGRGWHSAVEALGPIAGRPVNRSNRNVPESATSHAGACLGARSASGTSGKAWWLCVRESLRWDHGPRTDFGQVRTHGFSAKWPPATAARAPRLRLARCAPHHATRVPSGGRARRSGQRLPSPSPRQAKSHVPPRCPRRSRSLTALRPPPSTTRGSRHRHRRPRRPDRDHHA